MVYTSGILAHDQKDRVESLEEMQRRKMDTICDKIGLRAGILFIIYYLNNNIHCT